MTDKSVAPAAADSFQRVALKMRWKYFEFLKYQFGGGPIQGETADSLSRRRRRAFEPQNNY